MRLGYKCEAGAGRMRICAPQGIQAPETGMGLPFLTPISLQDMISGIKYPFPYAYHENCNKNSHYGCILGDNLMDNNDIEYFRKLLNGMLEDAQQNGDSTIEELTGNNEVFADPADRATAESDRAFTLRLRDRERRLIGKIQRALQRIEDGTYGICEECGEDISLARLKARPVTRLCINCKARQEEDEQLRGD